MTTPAAPNPQNVLLLAALGIGAYFLTRRAGATVASPATAMRPTTTNTNPNVLSTISSLFNIGKAATNAYDAQATADAAALASAATDGFPVNVPNTSSFNAVTGPQLPSDLAGWMG